MALPKLLDNLRDSWREGLAFVRKREAWPTIQRGRQLLVDGSQEEKEQFFAQAIQGFPDNAEIRILHAEALQTAHPEAAMSEAMKTVELAPDEPIQLTRAAYLASELGQPDLARQYAARARELGGADFLFAAELGHLESRFALQEGDEKSAEEGFRQSVEQEPQSVMFAVDLAKFLAAQGRKQEAVEFIDEAMEKVNHQNSLLGLRREILDQIGESAQE